ncbi:hypothetical protein MUG78_16790 [Gordonia alkaliphila]|uniref:hypothetical protein n=1 Tax=Gordonia alkaliphila TaxID=1053547 RepID=UPI001FF0FA6B|nr:hypothetical protein [Gordonia alkaliphila]MCK0441058.1 hypothetical protein [Gordonia alkaliphila]
MATTHEDNPGTRRIRVDDATFDTLTGLSDRTGFDLDTIINLLAEEHSADTEFERGTARAALSESATDYRALRALASAAAPDLRVAAIRLGESTESASRAADGLFDRDYMGANFRTGDPQLWRSTRGFWKISTQPNALAAYRLGVFLGLYGGVAWSGRSGEGRRWALTGYRVDGNDRVDPETGQTIGASTTQERELLEVLGAHRMGLPAGSSNPVVNLYA